MGTIKLFFRPLNKARNEVHELWRVMNAEVSDLTQSRQTSQLSDQNSGAVTGSNIDPQITYHNTLSGLC